jgi:hypothetical protein
MTLLDGLILFKRRGIFRLTGNLFSTKNYTTPHPSESTGTVWGTALTTAYLRYFEDGYALSECVDGHPMDV